MLKSRLLTLCLLAGCITATPAKIKRLRQHPLPRQTQALAVATSLAALAVAGYKLLGSRGNQTVHTAAQRVHTPHTATEQPVAVLPAAPSLAKPDAIELTTNTVKPQQQHTPPTGPQLSAKAALKDDTLGEVKVYAQPSKAPQAQQQEEKKDQVPKEFNLDYILQCIQQAEGELRRVQNAIVPLSATHNQKVEERITLSSQTRSLRMSMSSQSESSKNLSIYLKKLIDNKVAKEDADDFVVVEKPMTEDEAKNEIKHTEEQLLPELQTQLERKKIALQKAVTAEHEIAAKLKLLQQQRKKLRVQIKALKAYANELRPLLRQLAALKQEGQL